MRAHSGERPYCCNECGASFIQSSHLSIHKRSHTGEKPYQCDVCKQAFKQISHLRSHERIHTQTKPYSCEHCDKHFIQKSSLNRHRRIHTGEKPYACALCSAAFCVKSNLDRHEVIHTGFQPFTCELCGAAFGQSVDLKRHKMSHFGIKPFRCEECHACFSRNNNLMWHKNTHTGETPLKCDQCSCKFMRPRDLKKHKMSHAPSKAHSCPVCQQSFLQLTSLKKHMELHTGEKAFSCKECLTSFNDKSSLKRHMSKHSDSKPFECADCGSQFRELRSLKRHSFQVHGKKLEIKPQPKCSDTNQVINQVQDNVAASQQSGANDSNNHLPHQYMTYQVQMQDPSLSSAIQCNMYNGQESQPPAISYTSAPVVLSSIQPIVQTQLSTLMISAGPGQPMRTAKAANNCQNHSAHVITMASNNQWQTWCFCEVPNIPPVPLSMNILEGTAIPNEITPDFAHALQRPLQADQIVNENNLHVLESSGPTLGSGGQPLVLRSANGAPQAMDAKLSSNLQFHVIGEGPSTAQPVWVNGNWIQHK
ncbi:UNVERIFIED_CONTAM: hypothetical protein GTU68_004226 [Idotea baltica]|nr:hypothetical protein [Idotea baltica]